MIGELLEGELTGTVLSAFYAVCNALGFGFLENVYASALSRELRKRGLTVQREAPVQVYYSGLPIAHYKVDMLVNSRLVLELKSAEILGPTDKRQLFNCLRSTELQVGLLLHFGPKPGFHRVISTRKNFEVSSATLRLDQQHPV